MLEEMGLSVEDLLEQVDFTKRSKALRTDLKIPDL
jgi:sulfur carrier protein ThiS